MSEMGNRTARAEPAPQAAMAGDARLWRALTMVAVAMMGAFLAYKTGTYELRSVGLEREIVQQNLITVTERQRLLDFLEARDQLRRRADAYRALAESDAAAAAAQPPDRAELANVLALQAQEDFAAARALSPFTDALTRLVSTDAEDNETNVRRSIDRFKQARGIAGDADSMAKLDAEMEQAHEKVKTLARAVVLFILALVMFTLSDVYRAAPHRSRTWFAIGIVIALLATVYAAYRNRDLIVWLGSFGAGMLALFATAWILSGRHAKRAPPVPFEPQRQPRIAAAHAERHFEEAPHPDIKPEARSILGIFGHGRTRYSRWIIYLMAFTVLSSALLGFAYTYALIESSTASQQALKKQVDLNASVTADDEAIDALVVAAEAAEARARSQVLRYRASYPKQSEADAVAAAARAKSWDDAARNASALQWLEHPKYGADLDPAFPRRLLNERLAQSGKGNRWETLAMWDALNHQSLRWNHVATVLLQTITMLAVALYLLGHANAMGRNAGGWSLMGGGCLLLAIAATLAVGVETNNASSRFANEIEKCKSDPYSSADMPDELRAARYYARARVLLASADSANQFREALDGLDCMSALRHRESTLPRLDYVRAAEMESTSQTGQLFAGLPRKKDLAGVAARIQAVEDDYRKTDEKPPARVLATLGRYRFLQALADDGKDPDADQRKEHLKESVRLLTDAAGAMNAAGEAREAQRRRILISLAIAQYAAGQDSQGAMTSEAALAIAPAGARRIPGRALTDLQILGEHCDSVRREGCEKLAQHIGSLKGRLVAATWQEPGMLPVARSDDAKEPAKEVTIDVAPDGLRWSSPLPRISSQQQLALVWYERDTGWNAWRTMPDVSGPVATGANSVRRPERCIAGDTNAQYRAELYLDGTLIAFGEGTLAQGPRFKPWLLSDVDMALCAPAAWAAIDVPQHSDGKAMLVRAIGADDATPAIVLFVFYGFDRAAPGPPQQIDDVKHYLVQRGWIDEKSPLERREQTAKCDKGNENGLPAYVTWRTNEGVRQVAVALPGKLAGDACIALRSVNSRYAPDPGAAKPSRRPNVAAR